MNNRRWILLLLAIACLGWSAGCEKETEPATLLSPDQALPVNDEERQWGREQVEAIWNEIDPDVDARYDPAPEDRNFYRDLAVLTRHPHRLAGYGTQEGTKVIETVVTQDGQEATRSKTIPLYADEPGSLQAGQYVANRLRMMGYDLVLTQRMPVMQPTVTECALEVGDRTYTQADGFHAARPNVLQGAVTPAEGLTGQLLYAGTGEIAEYGGQQPEGRIVVLEYECRNNWRQAFAFGAQAVIFIGPEPEAFENSGLLHMEIPANAPRFYVTSELADELGLRDSDATVTIKAASQWVEHSGRNVVGVLRGTSPRFDPAGKDEAIVLAAPLDSLSEVPALSPGARDAANCAALLQMAERFARERPARDVFICFFDGQAQNHAGARAFYGALLRQHKVINATPLEERREMFESELAFRRVILSILGQPNVFAPTRHAEEQLVDLRSQLASTEGERREALEARIGELEARIEAMRANQRTAHRILAASAREFGSKVLDELRPLRITRFEHQREIGLLERRLEGEGDLPAPGADEAEEIRAQIEELEQRKTALDPQIHELSIEDLAWNTVEKILYEKPPLRFERAADEPSLHELNRPVYEELFEDVTVPAGADEDEAERIRQKQEQLIQRTPQRFATLLEQVRRDTQARIAKLQERIEHVQNDIRLRNAVGLDHNAIALHLSVNFGDERARWTFIHGDSSMPLGEDRTGQYVGIFKVILAAHRSLGNVAPDLETRGLSSEYDAGLFAPGKHVDSGAIARIFAIFNLSLTTSMDPQVRQGHPADVPEVLDAGTVLAQVRQAAPVVAETASAEGLSRSNTVRPTATFQLAEWDGARTEIGAAVKRAGGGSAMADRPVSGAVVALLPQGGWSAGRQAPPGFVYPLIVRTNIYGVFEVGPINSQAGRFSAATIFAATFDEPAGQPGIEDAGGARGRGLIDSVSNAKTMAYGDANLRRASVEIFKAHSKTVVGYGFARGAIQTLAMRAASTAEFRADRHALCESQDALTLYAPYDAKGMKLFNKFGVVLLNNQPTRKLYHGEGVPLRDPFQHPVSPLVTADDLLALNQYRNDLLQSNRISQESLQIIHSKADNLQEDARKRETVEGQFSTAAASAAMSRRAYTPLVNVMNDLVTAVVLLLLLAMPFAFALERLLIGTPHIYNQIGWFTVFFLGTFGVLYFVNPAFRIAATPVIIFLAFGIILLSSLVIFIMTRKLQSEIKKMQGLATTVHSADVSRLSTTMAAVSMGISTMRRRPLRTLLTAATVVLLTFTILTFASFGSSWGIRRTYEGPMSGIPRLLVRHQLWSPIDRGVFSMLRGYLKEEAEVVPRYWISPTAQEVQNAEGSGQSLQMLATSQDGEDIVLLAAAVGLDPRDLQAGDGEIRDAELRSMLDGDLDLLEKDGIFLTRAVSDDLHLTERDIGRSRVLYRGRALTYAGTIEETTASYTLLENSPIMPVDYRASGGGSAESFVTQAAGQALSEMPEIESAQFVHYNLDQMAIIPAEIARTLGGEIRAVTIHPHDIAAIQDIGERVAHISELPTYVGDQEGVHRLIFTTLAEASGWRDLLIPVLLGGLIIFATMLGSVSDREREIYTFSSLGLAPAHVASLFFAEASMYAVIGGMGGYLIGQAVARLLGWFSALGYIAVPTMNYSSTNAIITILIVMATVMISTIYPALKASRSANPGIQRAWRIPKPEGNLYDLVFPFTVSTYDITGVVSFLKEHFDNYSDTSLGVFATTESHIFRQADSDMLGFEATVALAPFDLGVTQRFALLSRPSEIEGIDEVRILIYRLSGAGGDWQRANRVFINELRKQLLIWRSLTQEIMERYRQRTLESWDSLPREQMDRDTIGGGQ